MNTGDRDLDLALMTAFQTCVWELQQSLRATQVRIDVFRCELMVHGPEAFAPPPPPADPPAAADERLQPEP